MIRVSPRSMENSPKSKPSSQIFSSKVPGIKAHKSKLLIQANYPLFGHSSYHRVFLQISKHVVLDGWMDLQLTASIAVVYVLFVDMLIKSLISNNSS